jgi:hypothetical protein
MFVVVAAQQTTDAYPHKAPFRRKNVRIYFRRDVFARAPISVGRLVSGREITPTQGR